MTLDELLRRISDNILNPIIALLFAVALLLFFWGIFQFIYKAEDETAREKGKNNMLYGVIGMFIMISAFAIARLVVSTIGADTSNIDKLEQL